MASPRFSSVDTMSATAVPFLSDAYFVSSASILNSSLFESLRGSMSRRAGPVRKSAGDRGLHGVDFLQVMEFVEIGLDIGLPEDAGRDVVCFLGILHTPCAGDATRRLFWNSYLY